MAGLIKEPMNTVGQKEKKSQQRIVKLFHDTLDYDYLGDWTDREGNANIETALLHAWLKKRGASGISGVVWFIRVKRTCLNCLAS